MTVSPDYSGYLSAIATTYGQWWELYTLMDAVGREQVKRQTEKSAFPFDFGLMVQTAKPTEEKEKGEKSESLGEKPEEKLERLPVLAGLRKYAAEHVLLVGRPGSGKSTALIRLLLEEAENESAAAKIPVLVELRYWQTGVLDRILTVLQQGNYLDLDTKTLKTWLRQGRLLLLLDGLNELPSEEARRDVATFRRDYLQTPMIFTTRELSVGGDLGIAKKLEIQPLTEAQMQEFVRAYLPPNQAEQMLRQLKDRLRELGQTPLLLWMLCGLFQRLGTVPPNLGMVFRQFTQGYERSLKDDIPVTAESRRWWLLLLQRLAFAMMQGENPQEKPTELQVAIAQQMAEDILTQYLTEEKFDKPRDLAKQWLEDLLKHHLIQLNGDKIEFRHQLIQEYYAAEYLLRQLPKLSDAGLQRQYLNYLKWTEAIALMLALVEDEGQALRVVELAIGVDLMLGARLAGEVSPRFQSKTVDFITSLDVPQLLEIKLLGETHSESAIPALLKAQEDEDSWIRSSAVEALGKLNSEQAISELLKALEHKDAFIRRSAAVVLGNLNNKQAISGLLKALEDEDSFVCKSVAEALGELNSAQAIPGLLKALEHKDSDVGCRAAAALGNLNSEQATLGLIKALENPDSDVRRSVVEALSKLNNEHGQAILGLIKALEDPDSDVRWSAAEALSKLNSEQPTSGLLRPLKDQDSDISWSTAPVLGELNREQAISELIRVLKDQESDVRWGAAAALGKLNSEQAILELVRVLKDQDSDVRRIATAVLNNISNEQVILKLLRALEDQDEDEDSDVPCIEYARRVTAAALGKLNSKQAIPELLRALTNGNSSVLWIAAAGLSNINSEQVIPELLRALKDKYLSVPVALVLGKLNSEQAILELLRALEHQNSSIRRIVAIALGNLNGEQAILGLFRALEDQDSSVRERAEEALGKLNSKQAILGLLRALEHQNPDVRERAAAALGKLNSEQAILGLLRALEHQNPDVRERAAAALGKLNREQAIPGLLRALGDEDLDVRGSAAGALCKLNSKRVVPGLLRALEHQNSDVREKAAEALGNLKNEQAIPGLLKVLGLKVGNDNWFVRMSAVKALGKVGNPKVLGNLWKVHDAEAYSAIASIQARCKFYNYEIFQAAQSLPPETIPQSSPSLIVQGDYIVGDKVEGDKAMGDKVTGDKNIHNIETVGILNTGTANVQRDQIGSQNNSDGKA